MMGGIVQGMSHFGDGVVQESNFDTYRVIRMSESPEIQVLVLSTPDAAPGGIGEAAVLPIGPAIANALAALTGGVRLRQYPFLPDRVKVALGT